VAQALLVGEVQFCLIGTTHVVNTAIAGGGMVMIMGKQITSGGVFDRQTSKAFKGQNG
jgi:hypothetical protein